MVAVAETGKATMKKVLSWTLLAGMGLGLAGCGYDSGTRAVTGGLMGAGGGAAIGALTGVGAGAGALIGGATGAVGGAVTAPGY